MKILKIIRDWDKVEVILQDKNVFTKRIFPVKMTDIEIMERIAGKEVKEEPAPAPVNTVGEVKEEVKKEPPKKAVEVAEDKRTLKAKYLRELKEKGVNTAGLITFSDVEKVYKKANGGE